MNLSIREDILAATKMYIELARHIPMPLGRLEEYMRLKGSYSDWM